MTDLKLAWLAGLLEGEGSFLKGPPSSPNRPRIAIEMTDEDVIRRVAALLGLSYVCARSKRNAKWKPSYRVTMRGRKAVALMKRLRPLMGTRRRAQIDTAIASYTDLRPGDNTRKLFKRDVLKIRRAVGVPVAVLSRRYGVSRVHIRRIQNA